MKLFNILLILFVANSYFNSLFSQNLSRIEATTGVLNDSNNCFGVNLKFNKYFKESPISLSIGLGYFKFTNREGFNEFNYSYYSNQNIVPSFAVNYQLYKNDKSFSIIASPRLSYFFNQRNVYTSKYNARKNANDKNDLFYDYNNMSLGAGIFLKKTNKKDVSVLVTLGADYLLGKNSRVTKSLLVGVEFPLKKLKRKKSVYTPSISREIPKEDKMPIEKPVVSETKTIKEETKAPTKEIKLTSNDTLIVEQKKLLKSDRIDSVETIVKKQKPALKEPPVITIPKKEKVNPETKSTEAETKSIEKPKPTVKEPPVITIPKKEKVKPEVKSTEAETKIVEKPKPTVKEPTVITIPKKEKTKETIVHVQGPLNIQGLQYELGDDWNYWLGEDGLWYAKRKSNAKWYDLLKSLSDKNYDKAIQILGADAKKVD